MIDALPEGVLHLSHKFVGLNDRGDSVQVEFEGREPIDVDLVVGADGIDSAVRKAIWGDSPKRYHGLHLMGGWFLSDEPIGTRGVFAHDRTVQGSYTPIRHEGRDGYEWWVLEKWTPKAPFTEPDIRAYALQLVRHFDEPLPSFIGARRPRHAPLGNHRSRADQAVGQGPRHDHRRRRAPDFALRRIRCRDVNRGWIFPRQGVGRCERV